ncbi:RagB/SusD family nutrient uptake outer membrane protein [Chitinophaga sp. SYP-B3965]|uniref:RagB/SusD family nutrient uptake outer membrane protein n=1 Tax=Chitinophaga sp. SYP-B3965 TaxID=2663120 RepID=UPI001299C895|nr:RagB/SusD family nutrient uptake outer membrane protein [Chitinophaga sp. SYP-B3965]MRG48342.1 RagB/SusD family nutrient uptake outer membrane protein [Chitinophaga sp. SYP-B3965]
MKIKYFILLSFISILTGSCNKFLDTKPKDALFPGGYYKTEAELDYALAAVYSSLGADGIYGNNALYLLGWSGDEGFMNRSSIPVGAFRLNHVPGDQYILAFWRECYNGLNRANSLLESVNNNPAIPEVKRNTVKGEALFLRAYFHFLLVQNFGGVPLKLGSVKSAIDVHIPKNTIKEVYDQIVKDMTEAEPLVGDISSYGFGGRVSKSAIRGMLMRVNLYMAGFPLKDVTRYQEVLNWGKKIMEDGLAAHRMNPSYSNIFITLASEKYDIKESIWEIEFIGNGTEAYAETGRNGWINGISTPNTNTGRSDGYMTYTAKLYNSYEAGDLRKFWNIPFFNYAALPAASGVKTLIAEIPLEATKYSRTPGKFRREFETQIPKYATRSPINVQLLRYTDVLLMYAEALNELQGPTTEAVGLVNQVRRRGWSTGVKSFIVANGGSGYTTAPTVTISAGNGSSATAKATVAGGVVTKIDLDRDATGIEFFQAGKYTAAPTVTLSGGGGTGAQATATIWVPEDADVKPAFTASKETFRKFLQDERLRELNFENIRRSDLVRWEIYEQTHRDMASIMTVDIPGNVFISYYSNMEVPKHLFLPIPSAEMVTNNKMVQNTGW